MPQITKLLKLEATQIGGNISLDLDTALEMSADSIRSLYGMLAEQTGKSEYGTAAVASYQFSASGFADSIYDVAFAFFESLSLGYSFSRCAGGEFTLTSAVETYEITHGLGVVPDFVVLLSPEIPADGTWAGVNNAAIIVAANWAGSTPVQAGIRAKTGASASNNLGGTNQGFLPGDATSSVVVFTCGANNTTGITLAPNKKYFWVAGKLKQS